MIDSVNLKATQPMRDAVDTVNKSKQRVAEVKASQLADRVSISETAKLIVAKLQADQVRAEDLEHINQLRVAIQSGHYQVNSSRVAEKLMQFASEA